LLCSVSNRRPLARESRLAELISSGIARLSCIYLFAALLVFCVTAESTVAVCCRIALVTGLTRSLAHTTCTGHRFRNNAGKARLAAVST